ncbi:MAG: hypothetical protein ACFE8P_02510, partial [Promethearchaeota archaeon]
MSIKIDPRFLYKILLNCDLIIALVGFFLSPFISLLGYYNPSNPDPVLSIYPEQYFALVLCLVALCITIILIFKKKIVIFLNLFLFLVVIGMVVWYMIQVVITSNLVKGDFYALTYIILFIIGGVGLILLTVFFFLILLNKDEL